MFLEVLNREFRIMQKTQIKKIALIKVPGTYANWDKSFILCLSYISGYLEKHGFECKIFDACFNDWSVKELINNVLDYNPDLFGITAMTHEINQAAHVASLIKKQVKIPAIVGGCHVTALPQRTLAEFPVFDYAIYGEGEKTILELIKRLQTENSPQDLISIKGIAFRAGKNIIVNEPRPFLTSEELNELPFPAYHTYYNANGQEERVKVSSYPIITSRGCPHNCAFCMRALGRKVRRRSPENICQEIEHAISYYGTRVIDVADEVFLFNNKITRQVLQLIIETGLPNRIKWSAQMCADMVTQDLVAMAKQAGCFRLGIGVESGDDEILKNVGKGITVEQVKKAVKIIKKSKLVSGTYFIIGHPNETPETAQRTIDLAAELNTTTIAVGLMVPYPGTKIYDMAKQGEGGYRLLSEEWANYDKYGGKTLEVENLSYKQMQKYQRKAYINLYLKNLRFIDLFKYCWKRKHALYYFLKRRMFSRTQKPDVQ